MQKVKLLSQGRTGRLSLWNPGLPILRNIAEGYQLVSMYDWDIYIVPGAFYYHDYLDEEKVIQRVTPA